MQEIDALKRQAAEAAVAQIESGDGRGVGRRGVRR